MLASRLASNHAAAVSASRLANSHTLWFDSRESRCIERLPNLMSQTHVQSSIGVERKECPTRVQAEGNSSAEVN